MRYELGIWPLHRAKQKDAPNIFSYFQVPGAGGAERETRNRYVLVSRLPSRRDVISLFLASSSPCVLQEPRPEGSAKCYGPEADRMT